MTRELELTLSRDSPVATDTTTPDFYHSTSFVISGKALNKVRIIGRIIEQAIPLPPYESACFLAAEVSMLFPQILVASPNADLQHFTFFEFQHPSDHSMR